jgi:hypothetical protein
MHKPDGLKTVSLGLGYRSVVEHLSSMCKALGFDPQHCKKNQKNLFIIQISLIMNKVKIPFHGLLVFFFWIFLNYVS